MYEIELRALIGRADFLYVADCKLANRTAMDHIAGNGGRFVTVLPRTRREDTEFRDWIWHHEPDWTEAHRRPGPRIGEPDETWHTTAARSPSAEGYRIIWVRSSAKIDRDAEARRARIAKGIAALDDLNQRLASPKTRIRTVVAVEAAAVAALDSAGAIRRIGFQVTETTAESFRQENRGRPGSNTRYRKTTRTHHRVTWQVCCVEQNTLLDVVLSRHDAGSRRRTIRPAWSHELRFDWASPSAPAPGTVGVSSVACQMWSEGDPCLEP